MSAKKLGSIMMPYLSFFFFLMNPKWQTNMLPHNGCGLVPTSWPHQFPDLHKGQALGEQHECEPGRAQENQLPLHTHQGKNQSLSCLVFLNQFFHFSQCILYLTFTARMWKSQAVHSIMPNTSY